MARLSNVRGAIQSVKPHKIGISFPKRAPWTPIIPASGPTIPNEILNLSVASKAVEPTPVIKEVKKPSKTQKIDSSLPLMRDGRPKFTDIPVTQIRNVIAKRLSESKQTVPHQYTSVKVNLDNATGMRVTLKERGHNVSMNDIVLKATAMALKSVPELNSRWNGNDAEPQEKVDICVAVATDQGLFAPCIKNVNQIGLTTLNDAVKDVAVRARSGKLKLEELTGGGFTVSNLGMFGVSEFTAVINTPQAGILAVGGIEKNFTEDGVTTNNMTMTLSSDGRAIHGDSAFRFVEKLKEYMENPRIMLLL